jgi:hypothetical protein
MKYFRYIIVLFFVIGEASAENCNEYLSYSDQERNLAVMDVLTNATPTQKITIAIMLGEACKGNMPEFSRSEANKDAGKLLPYLRQKKSEKIMPAIAIIMLHAITIGIAIGIAYFFNRTNLKWWRVLIGFLVGSFVSWFLGIIIWAYIFVPSDPNAAIVAGMPKSFWFAVVGGAFGVYLGRRKAKQSYNSNT